MNYAICTSQDFDDNSVSLCVYASLDEGSA